MKNSIHIIAEAGVNHNGSIDMAIELVDAAAKAGADTVKFQTFKAENLASTVAEKADYQKVTTDSAESQLEMLKKLELPLEDYERLNQHCKVRNIEFLSTAFDLDSLHFLLESFSFPSLKIPSGELTNAPFVLENARSNKDLIVSTGMASLGEIERALGVIAFGYLGLDDPCESSFYNAYRSTEGQLLIREKVTLLHCTTEYPAPFNEVNLNVLDTLKAAFATKVGYSDHTSGIAIPVASAAKGASIIEKHFTLDKSLPGPDHKASLEPDELKRMVDSIRQVELALGTGLKATSESEKKNIHIARKSLVATQNIAAGDLLSSTNLGIKRPGNGMDPYKYWESIGKESSRGYGEGDLIEE